MTAATPITVHCDASVKHAHAFIGFVAFANHNGAEFARHVERFDPPDTTLAELAAVALARRHFQSRRGITICTDSLAAHRRSGAVKIKSSNNRAHDLVYRAVTQAVVENARRGSGP